MSKKEDSFNCRRTFQSGNNTYTIASLTEAERNGLHGISRLPFSIKILLENLLRNEDNQSVTKNMILNTAGWLQHKGKADIEIAYSPMRVLMQDFTGVPAIADLAAMRNALDSFGKAPEKINPRIPVDLIIDHSLIVDEYGNKTALSQNIKLEYERNIERYRFLKWGQKAFHNLRIVPPGVGICHQINLEYLGRTVWTYEENGEKLACPDSCIGTDSHTTMINSLGVLAWGVGGIEAEAAMLGQPISMLLPEVIGFSLTGKLKEGSTPTDLVLTITQMLRKKGVVGKFVEFYGTGLTEMSLADRATISNMAPEYGATCGFFPVDKETIRYLTISGRNEELIKLCETYCKEQGLWYEPNRTDPIFTDTLHLDLNDVEPSMAGPRRPEERIPLGKTGQNFIEQLEKNYKKTDIQTRYPVKGKGFTIGHGDVVIAAITSCTNTSNPALLIGAGLLARNANQRGLKQKPWVKTSIAPGSQVVAEYLQNSGLQKELDQLGFNIVGFGCTTCIGNSGPLDSAISSAIHENDLIVASVLSGNRNFEGRVSPDVQANYLASPALVVASALTGTITQSMTENPIGTDREGKSVYLKDIWPETQEIQSLMQKNVTRELFLKKYSSLFEGDMNWENLQYPAGQTYAWENSSTYVRKPPYFDSMTPEAEPVQPIQEARILAILGDKITTDHISPAGSIQTDSPAGSYLLEHGVKPIDFNQYGTRRGNHEVMTRGTFANIRIYNHMLGNMAQKGGRTIHYPSGNEMSIYDAAMQYKKENVPLVVFAGVEYGNGSSRDWAAKGPRLLGIRAVIAESFERIHRSNLIGMGVVPFVFEQGANWKELKLKGDELIEINGMQEIKPKQKMTVKITYRDQIISHVPILCRIDTQDELHYYLNGGILEYVLRGFIKQS